MENDSYAVFLCKFSVYYYSYIVMSLSNADIPPVPEGPVSHKFSSIFIDH